MMAIVFGGSDPTVPPATGPNSSPPLEHIMYLDFDGEAAVADRASALRIALNQWLTGLDVDPNRVYDVVLATYEALANSVEHAYAGASVPGTLDLHAQFVPSTGSIEVVICDHGEWAVHAPDATRGRGVPLMHALADTTAVTSDHDGTTVRLSWDAPVSV
ncbi:MULTISPECIES: ATP-binding protein [unclassified Rhodococcus (in: high G+C Gram-positive bacteria)]|uniref:ATP-binding protein n=1 Tax=unclassified Rhodococcus (in: high G+C Gram-positive bacteria) TaxID=192944 RepID=UPI001FF81C67|nr:MULTISPECIES: ATP-binding protein [unclassified Rhodococcus (in: high G+C Gram-positive bacteria)]